MRGAVRPIQTTPFDEPYSLIKNCDNKFVLFHFFLTEYNFSHRIDHFSFGPKAPGLVSPLDGEMKVTQNGEFVNGIS